MQFPEVKHLYKYRPYNENTITMLINKKIWIPKPGQFNDPFDCHIEISEMLSLEKMVELFSNKVNPGITKEMIKMALSNGSDQIKDDFQKQLLQSIKNIHKKIKNTGVLTLSEKNDSILMWSHYADYHQGICIEFARTEDDALGSYAKPVIYDDNYPIIDTFDIMNDNNYADLKLFYTKAKEWEYEKEWRLLVWKGNIEAEFPAEITGIIFGLRMSKNHKKVIRNIFSKKLNIKFKQAVRVKDQFKVEIIDI